MTTQPAILNVGIVGLGLAGAGVAPTLAAMSGVNLVGAADVLEGILERIEASPSRSRHHAAGDGAIGGFAS